MDIQAMLTEYLEDRVFQLQRLSPGAVVAMPNGSEVELLVEPTGETYFLQSLGGLVTLIPFRGEGEQYRAAMGLAQSALMNAEFRSEFDN